MQYVIYIDWYVKLRWFIWCMTYNFIPLGYFFDPGIGIFSRRQVGYWLVILNSGESRVGDPEQFFATLST